MNIRAIAHMGCGLGNCPTVYRLEGTTDLVVQGGALPPGDRAALRLPEGEEAVRIPAQLVDLIVRNWGRRPE